jgi:hypothetical protein
MAIATDELLKRHEAFWRCEGRTLVAKERTKVWTEKPYPLKGGGVAMEPRRISASDVDVNRLVGFSDSPPELFHGDFLRSVGCVYPEAWMGSLIGCEIHVSAYGCVSKPPGVSLAQAAEEFSVAGAMESEWLGVMDRVLARGKDLAGDEYPVRQLHMRGVVDMLAGLLGEEAYCLAPFDQPEALDTLAGKFADLIIAAARRGIKRRAAWSGGYTCRWGLYAPGTMIDYQADASNILSPDLYEEFFMRYDRKVIGSFDYSIIHLHSVGLQIVEPLLKIDELNAIQINLDRETGVFEKEWILSCCERIQEASKALLINGELTEDEFAEFTSRLKPEGLAIGYWNP